MIRKLLKLCVLTMLAYLLQATAAYYIAVWDVAPNVALAIIAVITVACGRKYTLCVGLLVGYLLDVMMPAISYFNVVLYPVCAMLGALAFADKSERRMEEERALRGSKKRVGNLPAHLRTLLAACVSILVFEAVDVFYIYLSGVDLNGQHFVRALIDVVYTSLLAGVLQFPIRWWLGVYRAKREQER